MRRHFVPASVASEGTLTPDAPGVPPMAPARRPAPSSAPPLTSGLRLAPLEAFPTELAELELKDLQVLHSRICCQLEHEYLTDPQGPHPVTLDRQNELVVELSTRQDFLTPTPHLATR